MALEFIMEERKTLIFPSGGDPILRTSHFLTTGLKSIQDLSLPPLSSIKPTIDDLKTTKLKVDFKGRKAPQENWDTWVYQLKPQYESVWRKAGIYEPILASTYNISRHNALIIELADRWCSETNTFVFRWGEASITLEDMMVLGGYSVLGQSVVQVNDTNSKDFPEIEEDFNKGCRDLLSTGANYNSYSRWMDNFMGKGDKIEHAAFLCLWLSRYVFTNIHQYVKKTVFPIAINLSKGVEIALAPSVLAHIYRDLGLLKNTMMRLSVFEVSQITLTAPFQLVQLWAWERFPALAPPVPNDLKCGEPRSARWHQLRKLNIDDLCLRKALESAGKYFQWQPYAMVLNNWTFCELYKENGYWVYLDSGIDREVESFIRCVRVSELVGFDCFEQYLPHRVAMQFGFDQDIPNRVTRCNKNLEDSWDNYTRPIQDDKLYVPARLFETAISLRYFDWWSESILANENVSGEDEDNNDEGRLTTAESERESSNDEDNNDEGRLTTAESERESSNDEDDESLMIENAMFLLMPPAMAETSLIEEREDLLVSPTGGNSTVRIGHFLEPTVNSVDGQNLKLPSLSLSSESKWPLEVTYNGWRDPPRKWKVWVDRMKSLHESLWKQAGIYDAIMASTYSTRRNVAVLLGIAERWCSETNTFVFPWGEATVTLEDMMILGGFSVLGSPMSLSLQTNELIRLQKSLKGLAKSECSHAQHSTWINYFMVYESEVEHEAFLSLWLSRFVFPGNFYDVIDERIFPIAIHLSKGTRIALAPSVLASIYRDLGLLKQTVAASAELDSLDKSRESYLALTLWSPIRFVQIWAYERIPQLRSEPNLIGSGCHRIARWTSPKDFDIENVRFVIDSAGESFLWRPYTLPVDNWLFPKYYKQKEEWVSVNEALDEEIESFVRCLRVSELVGVDCIEPYLPHRVAMQFGLDQDLPKWIPRSTATPENACENYSRPICNSGRLYFPCRLFESDVTVRYKEWWMKSVLSPCSSFKGVVRRKRSARKSKKVKKQEKVSDLPPVFSPKMKLDVKVALSECSLGFSGSASQLETRINRREENVSDLPPGIPPTMKQDVKVALSESSLGFSGSASELRTRINRREENVSDLPPGFPPTMKQDVKVALRESSLGFSESKSKLEARISRLEEMVLHYKQKMLEEKKAKIYLTS